MPKNEDLYGFVLCRLLKNDCVIYCADDPTNSFPSGIKQPGLQDFACITGLLAAVVPGRLGSFIV